MLRTTVLLLCVVLFAGHSFADSAAPPQALEFLNVVFNRYPTPGATETITVTLRANTDCTANIRAICAGDIFLVAAQDSVTTASLLAGDTFTKAIAVTSSPSESARVTFEARADGCTGDWNTCVARDITIVPEYGSSGTTGARVGVYFDQNASVSCLPDSANYPFMTTAYIIQTDYDETSGPSAWDGRLEADQGIVLMDGGIAGVGLNLATFPHYRVGLSAALPVSSAIVLATVNVWATGPGGIYLKGFDDNNPAAYPSFVPDGGDIVPMRYANGGPQDIVASIGNVACPAVNTLVDCFASMCPAPSGAKAYAVRDPQERFTSQGGGDSQKRTNQTYNVSISGRVAYTAANGTNKLGIYGSRVEFWFVNRTNPSSWWHPIIGSTQHVHYDMLDENGAFSFNFSFVGDLTQYGVYDKIFILLNPENSGAIVPAPEDGYRVWGSSGYYDLLNERNGVTITITPANPNIQYYSENLLASRSYGSLLRNTKLSHEAISSLYGGQIPFSLPRLTGRVSDLTPGYAGFYHGCSGSPWLEIDQDAIQSYVTDHEYGHYVNHRAWSLDCSSNWTNSIGDEIQEGWAIFYSFFVRSCSQRTYGHEDQWSSTTEDPEIAPYSGMRYGNIVYTQVGHPEFAAWACYLWNLFDGYDDTGFEATPYVAGDNDDISGRQVRVFNALAGMPRNIPETLKSNYDWTFRLGLDTATQAAVGKVLDFMYADLNYPPSTAAMHSAQVRDLTIETPVSSQAIIRWNNNRYAPGYYSNTPSGHRLYKLDGSTWQVIGEVGWNIAQFTYSAGNVAGAYRVTAFNSLAGEAITAPEMTIGVSVVPASVDQGTRLYSAAPNPFNPETTIRFRVGKDADVRIEIVDVGGRRIRALANQHMLVGDHEVTWNGRDESGRAAASGLYFCRITADKDTDVMKLVLAK